MLAMWKSSTWGISIFFCGFFFLFFFTGKFGIGTRCDVLPGVLSQGRRGGRGGGAHRLQRAFCVKTEAEPPAWKFPAKSCDWLLRQPRRNQFSQFRKSRAGYINTYQRHVCVFTIHAYVHVFHCRVNRVNDAEEMMRYDGLQMWISCWVLHCPWRRCVGEREEREEDR